MENNQKEIKRANRNQINHFKEAYCKSEETRFCMKEHFKVMVESFEELLPNQTVKSYAFREQDITGAFIMFRVYDSINNVNYFPVFSETVGREMLKQWGMKVPLKRTIFRADNNGGDGTGGNGGGNKKLKYHETNTMLRNLILLVRCLMTFNIKEPQPMDGAFEKIYKKLQDHHHYHAMDYDIKAVNTALGNFLEKGIRINNHDITNLQDYINFLETSVDDRRLKDFNFDILREQLRKYFISGIKETDEKIYF